MNSDRRVSEQPNASVAQPTCNKGSSGMLQIDSGLATQPKRSNVDDKRKEEKAENIVNLICWGPNWS